MSEKTNYDWLISEILDEIHKGEISDPIGSTKLNYGAVSCPTGYGKSAIIFRNIIHIILDTINSNDKKLIVNLCTPIINLCAQQAVNLLYVLSKVLESLNIDKTNIIVYNNNSGDTKTIYSDVLIKEGYGCIQFSNFSNHYNIEKPQIAIVISCNKSLPKFINYFENKGRLLDTTVITYLDEAHTITTQNESGIEENELTNIDLDSLCVYSKVYLISATNKRSNVTIVNSFNTNNDNDDTYLIHVKPADAIKNNIICTPKCYYQNADEITIKICKVFMINVKNANPSIFQKILVTCSDSRDLENKRKELSKIYPVFVTSSKGGRHFYYKNQHIDYKNRPLEDFTNDIKNYQNDCFVLHIRQLISGVDVDSLTGCIICKPNTNDWNSYDNTIQTIGRCLRLGNERGIDVSKRKKKYADVLFVSNNNNATNDLSKFLINYYGIDSLVFDYSFASRKHNQTTEDLDFASLRISNNENAETYIHEEIKLNLKNWINDIIDKLKISKEYKVNYIVNKDDIDICIKDCCDLCNGDIYLTKYIEHPEIEKRIKSLLKKYNIDFED